MRPPHPARSAIAALVLLCLSLAAPSCASSQTKKLMQGWQGHTVRELHTTWGDPQFVFSDGQGGRVIVYVPENAAHGGPGAVRPRRFEFAADDEEAARKPPPAFEPASTSRWPIYRIFFADAHERIYKTEWRGTWDCCSQ